MKTSKNRSSLKPSRFQAEIGQQPVVLHNLVAHYRAEGGPTLQEWNRLARSAGNVTFVGMGTSEYVAEMVMAGLTNAGVEASAIDASELLHYPRPIRGVPVFVSQSGESVETRKAAERMKDVRRMVTVTNSLCSTLARKASLVLPMCAGPEATISTKTYSNTLAVLFLMLQSVRDADLKESFRRLEALADALPVEATEDIRRAAALLSDASCLHLIARGPAMAAAKQASLTFMEGTRISTAAFTGGKFRHGPFETVDADHRAIFFIPRGSTFELLTAMAAEVAGKGSRVVVITDGKVQLPKKTSCILQVPDFGEELFSLSAVTTQELLLDAIATRRGLVAGEFRHGEKVTTRE
jgi:glucosamine--fructose-6-phosphate aminotransferase (isomerizing)